MLLFREWVAIALFLAILASLVALTICSSVEERKQPGYEVKPEQITITFSGAVKAAGTYVCEPGITLKKLLERVLLAKNVDRKKVPFKKVLITSQVIKIPEKKSDIFKQ